MHRAIRPPNEKPSITLSDVQDAILSEHFFTAAQGDSQTLMDAALKSGAIDAAAARPVPQDLERLTFCVLILQGGHLVSGQSHCLNLEDSDAEVGKECARNDAIRKVWPLLAFTKKL